MKAQEAYILAKAYTNKSIEGAGSLKGAACQIKSIEAITGGHRITFEWEDNDGEVSTDTMDVMDGADGSDGVGISSIAYKETDAHGNYVYTVTLTDTNTYDIICPKGAQGETGATGATGNGIASIEKTGTAGLVDTYTITYTNGQSATFTVTNGESITVDSAMSGSSTNPVQNKVITEALALKQNATDDSLDTEAKTIVGAINEHEGDIGTLKSGLTELNSNLTSVEEWVNADAKTVTGNPITITDAANLNAKALSMTIVPDQNLHGYDHPWVGGAGKNKCAGTYTTTTNGGVTFTANSDGTVSATDTSSGYAYVNSSEFTIKAGTYIFSGAPSGNSKYVLAIYSGATLISQISNGTETSVTFESDTNIVVRCVVNGADVATGVTYKPMIRLSTETDATFAPYTNICPISGLTSGVVERVGKNLCPIAKVNTLNSDTFELTAGTYALSFKMAGSGMYSTSSVILRDDKNADVLSVGVSTASSGTVKNGQFTLQTKTTLHLYINNINADASGYYIENIQIELGTATAYEPYNSATATITFGQTVYGGSVDFKTGVLTVDRAIVEYDGDNEENWLLDSGTHNFFYIELTGRNSSMAVIANNCVTASISKTTTDLGVGTDARYLRYRYANDNSLTVSDLKTFLASNNLQVCYYLATPTELTLTPAQLELLKGNNTITANGATISLTYQQDNLVGEVMEQVDEKIAEIPTGGVDYTTTEQDTGVKWIDGKPIYQKTFVLVENSVAQFPVANSLYDVGLTCCDYVFLSSVFAVRNDGMIYNDSMLNEFNILFDRPNGKIYVYEGRTYTDIIVTVQYTKSST